MPPRTPPTFCAGFSPEATLAGGLQSSNGEELMADEQKRVKRRSDQEAEAEVEAPPKGERRSTEEVDKLISEIDEVLEENAEEFVRSYVQKGGQ